MEAFESWLLQRLAHAVEAGEVPADLLTELRTEIERAKDLPQEEGHALAVQDIAERLRLPRDEIGRRLTALEAQPTVAKELALRRTVEVWLAGQRRAYLARGATRESDGED
jgi:hypothetical protein